jgi:hypothetical protein
MDNFPVPFMDVKHPCPAGRRFKKPNVGGLPAAFGIEACPIQYDAEAGGCLFARQNLRIKRPLVRIAVI